MPPQPRPYVPCHALVAMAPPGKLLAPDVEHAGMGHTLPRQHGVQRVADVFAVAEHHGRFDRVGQ
ncbi:hypothetical protein D3C78_1569370 [compost metagenome]